MQFVKRPKPPTAILRWAIANVYVVTKYAQPLLIGVFKTKEEATRIQEADEDSESINIAEEEALINDDQFIPFGTWFDLSIKHLVHHRDPRTKFTHCVGKNFIVTFGPEELPDVQF